jgi:hypothetical protein
VATNATQVKPSLTALGSPSPAPAPDRIPNPSPSPTPIPNQATPSHAAPWPL